MPYTEVNPLNTVLNNQLPIQPDPILVGGVELAPVLGRGEANNPRRRVLHPDGTEQDAKYN